MLFRRSYSELPKMKKRIKMWYKLLWTLLLYVFIPISIFASLFIFQETKRTNGEIDNIFNDYCNSMLYTVNQHLSSISDITTLLEDNSEIRKQMKNVSKAGSNNEILNIKDVLNMPYSYRNMFTSSSISAVTIFYGSNLIYYALPSSIDLALQRCSEINNQNLDSTQNEGRFVWSGEPNSYAYWIKGYRHIYENLYYGNIVIELYPIPSGISTNKQSGQLSYQYSIDLKRFPDTQYYIYNDDKLTLFSSDNSAVGKSFSYIISSTDIKLDNNGYPMENNKYLVKNMKVDSYGLNLCAIVPKSSVKSTSSLLNGQTMTIVLMAMFFYFLLLIYIFHSLVRPFDTVRDYYHVFKEYPLAVPSLRPIYEEIQMFHDIIKKHIDDIVKLKQECDDNKLQIKEAEIKSLQAQMDPHFLFNILESIGLKAAQSGSADVATMVEQLGEMLQSNILFNSRPKLTLHEELQYTQNYLVLQQICARDFQYTINADEEILDIYYIPKLSLQPIVENCITHGFSQSTQGHINIAIWEDIDGIYLSVADDGCGFDSTDYFVRNPPEKTPVSPAKHNNYIALKNIQHRLQITYGAEYGLKIESEPGIGTTVIIHIPFDRNNF